MSRDQLVPALLKAVGTNGQHDDLVLALFAGVPGVRTMFGGAGVGAAGPGGVRRGRRWFEGHFSLLIREARSEMTSEWRVTRSEPINNGQPQAKSYTSGTEVCPSSSTMNSRRSRIEPTLPHSSAGD